MRFQFERIFMLNYNGNLMKEICELINTALAYGYIALDYGIPKHVQKMVFLETVSNTYVTVIIREVKTYLVKNY